MYPKDSQFINVFFLQLQMPEGRIRIPNSPGLARHLLVLRKAPLPQPPPAPTIGLNCLALRLSAFFPFAIVAGNGYIEGKELENFFQELEKARKGSGMVSPAPSPIVWDFLSS